MPTHADDDTTDAEQYVNSLDRTIQPGDVAYDKNSGSWLYVVDVVADSVDAYDSRNDGRDLLTYAGNQLTACTTDDRVVAAVHLNKNTTKSAGSGSVYDFPAGRLTRFVPEQADDDMRRIQDELLIDRLSDLWVALKQSTGDAIDEATLRRVISDLWGEDVKHRIAEMAQAKTAHTYADTGGQ